MTTELNFDRHINLADEKLGAEAIFATDDFFADKQRMLKTEAAVFVPDLYDENGKWMDGWESRRKRHEGYDYCIVRLGLPGSIEGLNIDTSNFTGNYAPSASVDACFVDDGQEPKAETVWTEILGSESLQGDSEHLFSLTGDAIYTHVRLNIYPDGGVARLRVYGKPSINWDTIGSDQEIDLAATVNGGRAIACNDEHFGVMGNLLNPGRGVNMGDGWETARRRTPGNDWVIIALGNKGSVDRIEIDTAHFKGNFPDSVNIQAACVAGGTEEQIQAQSLFWRELLPAQKLSADNIHNFEKQVNSLGDITHIRVNIYPDGGISRVRLFGTVSK
ncbi:Probable allantoicase-Allantoate amidinohydrolase [Moritella viscosa]|uniref:Probable allantoicase n=1 Tax=Moritella viscosa TaxID=80854 RepID=A0A090IEU9_9GAMM|nr:allantoicase [Moritella viscosa]CED59317.1 probable allantoicase [Moritella viscosa]SGY86922.1 Probable allantoicase-Allantoate amidinohydrolase [Moritella viscosa]SGY86969.1 Probable allantoicase-Allantoate amidinohydrolase [Moritella viscosa]SGY88284.1 Probable allantoicase-Allantoate amidinohydrolase [Moritella viscosa]SHO00269.1 Probable allantoicase-Allantoate amidinohydrolase [Moritella viscosa]